MTPATSWLALLLFAQAPGALQEVIDHGCEESMPALERQFAARTDPDIHRITGLALAQCQISSKRFGEATVVVSALLKDYPKDADVLYVSADLHRKAWNDAIYQMYRNTPSSFRVNQLSAEVFETEGRYPEAIVEYEKAIAKSPRAFNLHYRLGRAIILQSHDAASLDRAQKAFQTELSLNPADAAAEYQVGQIYMVRQEKAKAAPHLEKALNLKPDFPEALIAVAKLRSEAKQYNQAAQLLERAVKLQPTSETARYNLMMAYRNGGRTADAQREKAALEKLQKPPEGEFTDFLKRLGEKASPQ